MISATAGGSSRLVNIFRDHTVFEISKQFVILHLSVSSDMLLSARISDNIDNEYSEFLDPSLSILYQLYNTLESHLI